MDGRDHSREALRPAHGGRRGPASRHDGRLSPRAIPATRESSRFPWAAASPSGICGIVNGASVEEFALGKHCGPICRGYANRTRCFAPFLFWAGRKDYESPNRLDFQGALCHRRIWGEVRLRGAEGLRVTTGLLWTSALLLSFVAAAAVAAANLAVPRSRFCLLRAQIVWAAFLVWMGIWTAMSALFWHDVYGFFFPEWLRWPLPLLMGAGFAAASAGFWHAAVLARRASVLLFVLMGAALGPLTHVWAVFRGIVSKPPMLQGASPLAAVVVSFPEFAIYFSVIVFLAAQLRRASTKGQSK